MGSDNWYPVLGRVLIFCVSSINIMISMSSIKIGSLILLHVYISTAARAPDSSDPVNFTGSAPQPLLPCHPFCGSINTAPAEPRDGRQSVLGCLKGCTRELRPVRGKQGVRRGSSQTSVLL